VILTPPKPVTARILFEPELPPAYSQYLQRQPNGATIKIQAVYATPFWRSSGLSGAVVSDTGPIEVVYDNSPPDGSPGVLVGFAEGNVSRALFGLSPEQRRHAVLESLARYFGAAALSPTDYHDMAWATEAFTLGAYGSFNPPGVLTSMGESVDGPAGNVWFAGADYSPEWPGYMEGAIRSGSAVAKAVLATL
jgi:monoamine oxidase